MNVHETTTPFKALLGAALAFLYVPIVYIVIVSFNTDALFVIPYEFTVEHYQTLAESSRYNQALSNSVTIAVGTGVLSMVLGASGAWAVTRYDFRGRYLVMGVFILPLIVPTLITAVSGSLVLSELYQMDPGLGATILLQSVHGMAFSFLIMLTQLSRYPTELDEAAETYGASKLQRMREVTLPIIWPGLFGAFLLPFLIAFNNFDLTFYAIGASSSLPTVTWGQLRHGIRPTLFAISSIIVFLTLVVTSVLHLLGRYIWREESV